MCITFFCSLTSSKGPCFILGFNREELTQRETLRFGQFQQDPNIYGGKDTQSGGTWLGINIKTGLLVFLTNYSMLLTGPRKGISRGKLVMHFLSTQFIPQNKEKQTDLLIYQSLQQFSKTGQLYSPFNLVIANLQSGNHFYICSEKPELSPMKLLMGQVYGLSNCDLTTHWRKTSHGMKLFKQIIDKVDIYNQDQMLQYLTKLMQNTDKFDEDYPQMRSIFIEPYWNQRFNAQRRTKTTSLLLLTPKQDQKQLLVKEITYMPNKQESTLQRLII